VTPQAPVRREDVPRIEKGPATPAPATFVDNGEPF
jgi:hypothetical protein